MHYSGAEKLLQENVSFYKVLAFKESYHLISFSSENVILKGKGTKVAEVKIY